VVAVSFKKEQALVTAALIGAVIGMVVGLREIPSLDPATRSRVASGVLNARPAICSWWIRRAAGANS